MNSKRAASLILLVALVVAVSLWIRTNSIRSQNVLIRNEIQEKRAQTYAAQTRVEEAQARAEVPQSNELPGTPIQELSASDPAVPLGTVDWNSNEPYVDLPKTLLSGLRIGAIRLDGEVDPTVATALDISEDQGTLVRKLYVSLQERFVQLENSDFRRTEAHLPTPPQLQSRFVPRGSNGFPGVKISFDISPPEEEMESMRQEWHQGLIQILGATRGDFIFDSPAPTSGRLGQSYNPVAEASPEERAANRAAIQAENQRIAEMAPSWLTSGTNQFRITFVLDNKPPGSMPGAIMNNSFVAASGEMTPEYLQNLIPSAWRRFVTPEMLVLTNSP